MLIISKAIHALHNYAYHEQCNPNATTMLVISNLIQCIAYLILLHCTTMLIISKAIHALHNYAYHQQCNPCTAQLRLSWAMQSQCHNYACHKQFNSMHRLFNSIALHNYAYHKQSNPCTAQLRLSSAMQSQCTAQLCWSYAMHCTTMLIISSLIPYIIWLHCTTMLIICHLIPY